MFHLNGTYFVKNHVTHFYKTDYMGYASICIGVESREVTIKFENWKERDAHFEYVTVCMQNL